MNLIYGTNGDDWLAGTSGDDYLDGLGGTLNVLEGGAGDDYYVVRDHTIDSVIELPGGGIDTVRTSEIEYDLPLNCEILIGANHTHGQALGGNAGDNTITGWDLADTLNGGGGSDLLTGGGGNNSFYVDSASTP